MLTFGWAFSFRTDSPEPLRGLYAFAELLWGKSGLAGPIWRPQAPEAQSEPLRTVAKIDAWALPGAPKSRDLQAVLANAYTGRPLVEVAGLEEAAAMKTLDAELLKNSNRMKLFVFGNDNQARLVAALDNLGKGAGGAAVQNLNIMLGLPETAGL